MDGKQFILYARHQRSMGGMPIAKIWFNEHTRELSSEEATVYDIPSMQNKLGGEDRSAENKGAHVVEGDKVSHRSLPK